MQTAQRLTEAVRNRVMYSREARVRPRLMSVRKA